MVRRGAPLRRKLLRDLRQNAMQFAAMLLLCALGTWVFAGLDGAWRMQERTIETYLTQQRLPDLWVRAASFTRQDAARLRHLPGVDTVQPRGSLTLDAVDLDGKVTVALHAMDGQPALALPLLRSREGLLPSDARGCLVEEQFAQAQGLQPGDRLTLDFYGEERTLIIRGLVLSPEYLITARDMAPDPSTYGFALCNLDAFPEIGWNELLVSLENGADPAPVERAILDLLPGALTITQATHASTQQGRNFIALFRSMSYLFPVLVYFVAALVVVTTIARMLASQRSQMGLLKALGFTNRQIRRHYLGYALWPSLTGSALGLAAAQFTVPQIIWRMVAVNLRLPRVLMAPISPIAWVMAAAEVLLSLIICLRHLRRSLRETAAELLRPLPPRSGARVLLERWTGLWRRFSFNAKMIIRNTLRNRGRTLMSMTGMLFCNMLIICSFGLQESIPRFVGDYFYQTLRYDTRIHLDAAQAGELRAYQGRLEAERVDGLMDVSVSLRAGARQRTALITVLPDGQESLFLGENGALLPLPDTGVVLTEKLAALLGVGPGDTLEALLTGDTKPVSLRVEALAEVNIGLGVYMSQRAWELLRKGAFRPTSLLLRGLTPRGEAQLEAMDEVSMITWPQDQYSQTMRMMDAAAGAFSLLSGVALGLAFVICYNMGLLNFTERVREYATLKVLGYHQREIRWLMLRENDLTAIFGVAAGIPPGIALVRLILRMCEFDSMRFVPHVSAPTVLLSSAATFAFTWLIEWLLTRKVRGIDMVEALKSVE